MEHPINYLAPEVVGGKNDREETIQSYMSECGYTKKQAIKRIQYRK